MKKKPFLALCSVNWLANINALTFGLKGNAKAFCSPFFNFTKIKHKMQSIQVRQTSELTDDKATKQGHFSTFVLNLTILCKTSPKMKTL